MKDISSIGVSSIIATVLMLIITTSLSGLAYLYISGTLTSKTAQSFSIISTYKDTVTIQNDGTLPLSSLTATVDGDDVPIAVVPNIGGSVGYWSFNDQNNPTADNSNNGNDGTFYGETFNDGTLMPDYASGDAPERVDGKFGKALEFDGVDDYVEVIDSAGLNPDYITIEAWIYPESDSKAQYYLYKVSAYELSYDDSSYGNDEDFGGSIWDNTNNRIRINSQTSYPINNWYHVVMTADSNTGTLKLYVDAELKNTIDFTGTIQDSSNKLTIGDYEGGGFTLDGKVDEVRIFNRSLTQEEIQAEMESSVPTIRPVAAWSFEEGPVQYANDTHVLIKGEHGSALSFDGIDDYVNCGNDASLDITDAITVGAWVKFNYLDYSGGTGTIQGIGGKGDPDIPVPTPHYGWWFIYDNRNNNDNFDYTCFGNSAGGWHGGGNGFAESEYDYVFSTDTWYHIAFTVTSSEAKLYINGAQHGSTKSISNLQLSDTTRNLIIGGYRSGTTQSFNGTIDQVRIFNRALSPEEISSLYSGLVSAGQIATVKFLTPLTQGTHTLRLCTPNMCQGGYLTII